VNVLELRQLAELAREPLTVLEVTEPAVFAQIVALLDEVFRPPLKSRIGPDHPHLHRLLDQLDLAAALREQRDLKALIREKLDEGGGPARSRARAARRLDEMEKAGALITPWDPALPLDRQPFFAAALAQAQASAIAQVAGLAPERAAAVLDEAPPGTHINAGALRKLETAGAFTPAEARALGLAVSLYSLFDENEELAATVKPTVGSVRDLAARQADDWESVLRRAAARPPRGTSIPDYATQLERRVAALFPTDALLARLAPADVDAVATELAGMDREQLSRVANSHPGLGIDGLLDTHEGPERVRRIAQRISLVGRFRGLNPDAELLQLDYSPGSPDIESLSSDGMSAEDRRAVLTTLRAYQRIHRVAAEPATSQALLAAGYAGSAHIVRDTVQEVMHKTGLDLATAGRVHQRAADSFANVTAVMGTILDATRGGHTWSAVANLAPDTNDYLKRVPGYAELFGSQSTCACEHCQSILSPAAYFVDLMGFVDQHVLKPHFADEHARDPLNLKIRRPRLWELPLTCQNTDTPIPTLDIVNEVLEDYVARHVGYRGPLEDRGAVEQVVYQTGLSGTVDSFRQPFWLPLHRLTEYLSYLERTRWDVTQALEAPAQVQTESALNLSRREYELLVIANTDPAYLRHLYCLDLEVAGNGQVTPFDLQALLGPMGVNRDQLGALLATRFVGAGSDQPIQIRAEKNNSDSVQKDIERVHGLTADALDRLHRFTRLHARLPWSVSEFDLVLTQLNAKTLGTQVLEDLVAILWVQQRLGIGVEELCALTGDLPELSVSAGSPSPFDRSFNRPTFPGGDATLPQPNTRFVHPAFRPDPALDASGDPTLARLIAGLGIDDTALFRLIVELQLPLGIDPSSANENDRGFPLSAANLSLLYRHARLATHLNLPITDFFQLINLAGAGPRRTAVVHYQRLAGDYDDPLLGSWGLHLWGDGLAPEAATAWDSPMPRTGIDDYGAVYEVSVADPAQPISYMIHLPGQNNSPLTLEPGGDDRSFIPARHAEVWVRQGDPSVRVAPVVRGLDDVVALLRFHQWRKDSGYSLDDLGLLTAGHVEDRSAYPAPAALANDLVNGVGEDGALSFAETLFAFLPTVTEEQSREIVKNNPTAVLPAGDREACRLEDSYNPDTVLLLPQELKVAETDARELLNSHHFSRLLPTRLGAGLALTPAKTRELLDMAGMTPTDVSIAKALRGAGETQPLVDLMTAVQPLAVLFRPDAFDVTTLQYISANRQVFGIADFRTLDITAVRRVATYAALTTRRDEDFSTSSTPADPAEIRAVLLAFTAAEGFAAADPAMLGRVLGIGPGLAATVRAVVTLPPNALDAIGKLARCASLARHLGVGGDTLANIASPDFASLSRAADTLVEAVRSQLPDERVFAEQTEPLSDRLRGARRDALIDYLIYSVRLPFITSRSDLYHHFLIDPRFEGCARTTRVASAIASVQLYVHRILLNLEQDRRDTADPNRTQVLPSDIPADEWTWRRNYRVWEANRKVFLYPENYLEPGLRDGKSPQFEALEENLLQRQVDDDTVIDAYATYLRGFEEVAKLQIAGAWCDRTAGADVLHLIGASSDDPPVFYHRTAENLHRAETNGRSVATWTAWRPIEVQIPVRRVSPLVERGRMYLFWTQYSTLPKVNITGGSTNFNGYQHRMELKYSVLRSDGTWAPPQDIAMTFHNGATAAVIEDPKEQDEVPRYSFPPNYPAVPHREPIAGYGLRGYNWDVYPEAGVVELGIPPILVGQNATYQGRLDLYRSRILWTPNRDVTAAPGRIMLSHRDGRLYTGQPEGMLGLPNAWANLILDWERLTFWMEHLEGGLPSGYLPGAGLLQESIANIGPDSELRSISGAIEDVVVQTGEEGLLVQLLPVVGVGSHYAVRRISTTLADGISERLFTGGIDGLLACGYQLGLRERASTLIPQGPAIVEAPGQDLDYPGANGVYLREIFFHVPFLLADHLKGQGRYGAARRWFHYLFDPTASEPLHNDFRAVGCAFEGDRLQVCGVTAGGGVWLRSRGPSGAWDPAFTDMKAQCGDKGQFVSVDCGAEQGTLHVCGASADGRLWHTVRDWRGLWQPEFGDVEGAAGAVGGGGAKAVGSAADRGSLHLCVVTKDGRLLHTIRNVDRSWKAPPWDDVGVLAGIAGEVVSVACAVDQQVLHVCGVTTDGRLMHTVRLPDGTWPAGQDLKDVAGDVGQFVNVGCAVSGGALDVVGVTQEGRAWQATFQAGGAATPFVDLEALKTGAVGDWLAQACAAESSRPKELQVCGVTADGRLRHTTRTSGDGWQAFDDGHQPERDRTWRYREFRGLEVPRLREILTDRAAIEAYRKDPFNPHAIARLRLSAYQKSVVMKYLDNLLGWGDSLFTEFTAEAVNEAALMYQMAADILGPRPADVGECGDDTVSPWTYEKIDALKDGSEFLIEVETLALSSPRWRKSTLPADAVLDPSVIAAADDAAYGDTQPDGVFRMDWKATRTQSWQSINTGSTMAADDIRAMPGHTTALSAPGIPSFGWSLLRQVGPVFCVPPNRELLRYWDRVQDQQLKIWRCQNIAGAGANPAPWAAAIDPRILVAARAAGVSIEDALTATSGNLPPYRFSYLIERAKSQAGLVQSLGAALLSALEKRDGEELARLHAVHQQNLLSLGAQAKKWEVEAAEDALHTLQAQKAAADYRLSHYKDLISRGNNKSEQLQDVAGQEALQLRELALGIRLLDAILFLLPQLGAPTALKWGGAELGQSLNQFAALTDTAASLMDTISASAGREAGFQRRDEEWEYQAQLAERDIAVVDKQIAAATLSKQIAEESLALHTRTTQQAEEVFELYKTKFSNLDLYTRLAGSLQRLHREAFNGALAMARLAEQALRFERGDDIGVTIGNGYWDAASGGLLAGERLNTALLEMESWFLQTNYRDIEIEQSFSLMQLDPAALVKLRETGECDFGIPEIMFDLFYPGHYRRRIRAVHLTIPAVTGPYVNVSAELTLLDSSIRSDPEATDLATLPPRRSVSIATSTAKNDGGVFEMSFHDDRYSPFEGQGAISHWQLTLPKTFRQFDYQTISDVITTIAYTAKQNSGLRKRVQAENSAAETAIYHRLQKKDALRRVFSLRHDFPEVFQQLIHKPLDTAVMLEITANYLPAFLVGRPLTVALAVLALRPREDRDVTGLVVSVGGTSVATFTAQEKLGGLPGADVTAALPAALLGSHELRVTAAGDLAADAPRPGDPSALDEKKLLDILLYLEFKVSGGNPLLPPPSARS
jgi:hypothetical protein